MDKPKLNIVDLIIILIIALAVVFGIYSLKKTDRTLKSDKKQEIVFSLIQSEIGGEIKTYYEETLKVGDTVMFGKESQGEAEIESVEIVPSKVEYNSVQSGEKKTVDSVNKYDVIITFSAKAKDTNAAYLLSDLKIKVGNTAGFKKKDIEGKVFKVDGEIIMLDDLEAAENGK